MNRKAWNSADCFRFECWRETQMCRLLYARSDESFRLQPHLEKFAEIARTSPEDQSHGWGCAWLKADRWHFYHSLTPVWDDDLSQFESSNCLLAHARSAFRNEGIEIANNMPFYDGQNVFIFNGELTGVQVREEGRIGAEKVFNFVKRFNRGNMLDAILRGVAALERKTRYVRAMNFIIAESKDAWLNTQFSENQNYFQMYEKSLGNLKIVSSAPYAGESDWHPIENRTTVALEQNVRLRS